MKSLTASPSETLSLGYFRIFAKPPGGSKREITVFRGAPIMLNQAVFSDPFTHQTAQISAPQITPFDNPGQGDLDWLTPDTDIDIIFENTGGYGYEWSWEGYIASYSFSINGSQTSFEIDLKGAFYGLDDYLAIPSFPNRPIPYEILISKAFDQSLHPSRLGQFRVLWPAWWNQTVPEYADQKYLSFLKPWGVATGMRWTGFTSRSTGSWEPLLTGHVQSMLSVMFAEGGAQWSIRNRGQRRPELYLRQIPDPDSNDIIEIDIGLPGVGLSGSRDFTQRASVIYGQGVDDAGVSYSGLEVTPDGKTTRYRPFAYSPVVYPRVNNPTLDRRIKPKETMIRFQDGVDEVSAQKIALGQLQRFAEPGITGSITLQTDPRYADGRIAPRMLIPAASTIRLKGLFGVPDGVLAHVTQATADFTGLTMTLEFDTKYRDQLTVDEVKARTRDALTPLRALQVGKYSNTVQDLILPWSYKEGSGCMPQGSREFFNEKLPSSAEFPYEDFTTQFPPKNPAYRGYYIRINPTNVNDSTKNWSGLPRDGETILSIPVRFGQAGTIKLSQVAAYDKDGHVLPVRFHCSLYYNSGVNPTSMPQFHIQNTGDPFSSIKFLHPEGTVVHYAEGQYNPFIKDAWENVNPDGTVFTNDKMLPEKNAGLVVGWGNYYEPAGYSPGRFSRGASRTGILEDTTQWTWDLTTQQNLNVQDPSQNATTEGVGNLYVMIFCDEQLDEPVYFMGKFFRLEPGTS